MDKIKDIDTNALVNLAVSIDRRMKLDRRRLDAVKAEITARGNRIIDDSNLKRVKFYSSEGLATVGESQSLDLIRVDGLKDLISEDVWKAKVKETTETKYKLDTKLDRVLKAIFTGEYTFEYALDEFIDEAFKEFDPDAKQKAVLLKKLKGDFDKDYDLLCDTFGIPDEQRKDGLFDVELWYIYRIRNAELIRIFLPEEDIDHTIEEIKKCLIVDSKLSITIDYEDK